MTTVAELAEQFAAEAQKIREELDEIELLINQARTEAARHEARRGAAADKLAAAEKAASSPGGSGAGGQAMRDAVKDLTDAATQLVSVARRSVLMEAQIDLLEGKRKTIGRLHDAISDHAARLRAVADARAAAASTMADGGTSIAASHLVMTAQEDLRREISRAMHDGPAQSLTNIVLQAQIVERLVGSDPEKAQGEVRELVAMVQRTLDATKTFIFDVRPMVLDDLGLVPTLRRACRDRGQRAGVKIDFESVGLDRRLPAELESGLFRILDDALASHIAAKPETLALHLDWGDRLAVELMAGRTPASVPPPDLPDDRPDLPPAMAAMVEERREAHRQAVEAARLAALVRIPDRLWREIAGRAELLGIHAELLDEGTRLHLTVPLPSSAAELASQPIAGEPNRQGGVPAAGAPARP
jgi:two-component system sensor histidine kinase DegS